MSGAKVDVLAVMDAAVNACGHEWFSMHDKHFGKMPGIEKELDKLKQKHTEAVAARAAVAELIEALREIADVTTPGEGVSNEVWINERALAALSNIGPQS